MDTDNQFARQENSFQQLRKQLLVLTQIVERLANQVSTQENTDTLAAIRQQTNDLAKRLNLEADLTTERLPDIEVERMIVRDQDGTRRLVIHNKSKCPGIVLDGKVVHEEGGREAAGMIFFTEEGWECGGLIFGGKDLGDGKREAGGTIMFDQFHQDQSVGFMYQDENGARRSGFLVWDQPQQGMDEIGDAMSQYVKMPDGPEKEHAKQSLIDDDQLMHRQRVFVGRNQDKQATVDLKDNAGNTRVRLVAEAEGTAYLEFFNADGEVTHRYPHHYHDNDH